MDKAVVQNQSQSAISEKEAASILKQLLLIRRFEERLLQLFDEGVLFGTTHCYIGQEADAVGVLRQLSKDDVVWSSHRCHGHYLTVTKDVDGLMAELMGKSTGVVGGRGGSQHLCHDNFYSNGVQGGIVAAATGMAFAEKMKKTGNIAVVFLGDGTLGEGLVYECFNLASLWKLPVLFVIENNRFAQSTPTEKQLAGTIAARPQAFGIKTTEISSFDALEIAAAAKPIVDRVRKNIEPEALVINTYRFCHHSKSDDYRDKAEIDKWRPFDPIGIMLNRVPVEVAERVEAEVKELIQSAEAKARLAPLPTLDQTDLDAGLVIS